jgi:maltose alpha-D-glucosyltransferase/alpha-amylase
MQWDASANHGFSTAPAEKLWLPTDESPDAPTVAAEESDPASLLAFTRDLLAFRKAHPALSADGGFTPVYAVKDAYPFIFLRSSETEKLLVILNPADRVSTATVKGILEGKKTLIKGTPAEWTEADGKTTITVAPRSYAVYSLE